MRCPPCPPRSSVRASSRRSIYDPATGLPFPGNAIPDSRISAASRGLLDFIPLPNLPGAVQNYQFVTSTPQNMDNLGVRVSRSLTTRDRLSAGFQLQQRHSETAQTFGFRDVTDGRGLSFNIGWTRNLTQSFINSLRVDFSRNRTGLVPFFANGADVAGQLGIQGTSGDPANYGPPNLSFTNFGALSDAAPSLRRDQAAGLNEDVTLIHGKHTTRAGIGYRRNQFNTLTDENGRGSFTFSGLLTSRFDASGNPQPGTGFDMGDFLLGLPQSSSVRYGNSSMYFRGASLNGFVQDDWRIHSNFSLNLGLRYEYSQPVYEKYGRTSNLAMAPGFTGVTLVTPGLVEPDRNNFSPRIGVAWKPGKSFLVRSGYGIYYNGSVYNGIAEPARAAASLRLHQLLHDHARQSPDHRNGLAGLAFHAHHQHLRGGQRLPRGIRADLEHGAPDGPAPFAGPGGRLPRHEGNAARYAAAAQPGAAGFAGQCRKPPPHAVRGGLPLGKRRRQLHLSRRSGPADAPLPARRLFQRALHVLEIHRQRGQLRGRPRHGGAKR